MRGAGNPVARGWATAHPLARPGANRNVPAAHETKTPTPSLLLWARCAVFVRDVPISPHRVARLVAGNPERAEGEPDGPGCAVAHRRRPSRSWRAFCTPPSHRRGRVRHHRPPGPPRRGGARSGRRRTPGATPGRASPVAATRRLVVTGSL